MWPSVHSAMLLYALMATVIFHTVYDLAEMKGDVCLKFACELGNSGKKIKGQNVRDKNEKTCQD